MTDKELEQLLKECKPVVKDDYSFMLEVLRRTSAFEGIKNDVDRQRKRWHKVLWITFFIGIAAGILIYAITLFFKEYSILAFPDSWIYYIVSALAITITLVIVTTLDTNKQSALGSEAKTVRE